MTARQPQRRSQRNRTLVAAAGLGVIALLGWVASSLTQQNTPTAIGAVALDHAKALVAFGPRPSGSEAHQKMQTYITEQLRQAGLAVEQDSFVAQTPIGAVPMNNVIGRLTKPGGSGRVFVLASHYETKLEKSFRFVGANDGGSSTGLLLALAPLLAKHALSHEVWLVFFDGEEAFEEWSESDSLYGSRHLAAKWKAEDVLPRIGAFLLVDMIGDADLDLLRDANSTPWLRDQVWSTAQRLGYSRNFLNRDGAYEDDHRPFAQAGVPVVDLIDYNYGPGNRYWHTAEDTVDKLSARSLQIVADVLLQTLSDLDRQR